MVKIAIAGRAKSGKNTAADFISSFIKEKEEQSADILAFADPIKIMVCKMFSHLQDDFLKESLWGPSEKRSNIIPDCFDEHGNPLTFRKVLTDLGAVGRIYNSNQWINSTMGLVSKSIDLGHSIIISDVRFPNELIACQKHGFKTIRVIRPVTLVEVNDISENALNNVSDDEFDFVINNNSSLKNLYDNLTEILSQIT